MFDFLIVYMQIILTVYMQEIFTVLRQVLFWRCSSWNYWYFHARIPDSVSKDYGSTYVCWNYWAAWIFYCVHYQIIEGGLAGIIHSVQSSLKGTLAWDFFVLVFCTDQDTPNNEALECFEFVLEFADFPYFLNIRRCLSWGGVSFPINWVNVIWVSTSAGSKRSETPRQFSGRWIKPKQAYITSSGTFKGIGFRKLTIICSRRAKYQPEMLKVLCSLKQKKYLCVNSVNAEWRIIWISRQNLFFICNDFRVWIRGPGRCFLWKKNRSQKSRASVPLMSVFLLGLLIVYKLGYFRTSWYYWYYYWDYFHCTSWYYWHCTSWYFLHCTCGDHCQCLC
jgi:hypothetical protein